MLTGKQRAYLRKMANTMNAAFQVGKQNVTPEFAGAIDEFLEAREIVKISILNNCEEEPKDVAKSLSEQTRSECVQVIGKKIVLYRKSHDNPSIQLP